MANSNDTKNVNYTSPYELDGRLPLREAIPYGLQHALSMFASNLTAPLIILAFCSIAVGSPLHLTIIRNATFIAGVITLVQLYPIGPIGGKLPLIMGTDADVLGIYMSIIVAMGGGEQGYAALLGACILGGIVEVVIGFCYQWLERFFPPVVMGTTLTAIGIALLPIGAGMYAGGTGVADFGSWQNLLAATVTLLVVVVVQYFGSGFISRISILIGIAAGYVVATIMTYTLPNTGTESWVMHWETVKEAAWFSLPALMPVKLTFNTGTIFPVIMMFIILTMGTMSSVTSLGRVALGRPATHKELKGSMVADGLGSTVAAFFGVLPNTVFTSNIGICNATKVINRFSIMFGALLLVLCSFCPKLMAILSIMPSCIIGGAVVMIFGTILISGFEILAGAGFTGRNNMIVAVSFGTAYGLGSVEGALAGLPQWFQGSIGSSGIIMTAIFALILNILLPEKKRNEIEDAQKLEKANK